VSEKSDLRKWCSEIRDQLSCGSCTVFCYCGTREPVLRIRANNPTLNIDLSERDLFSCSGGTCETGNTMNATLNQAMKGVCLESCCPYDGKDHLCGEGRCPDWQSNLDKLASWGVITSVTQMKSHLDKEPLCGTMAVHQSFLNYVSGVYHNLGDIDPIVGYHAIAVVGYDDELAAWLLRNSWGKGWGIEGYCWIAYGDSEIDTEMYQLNGTPTPSPCKIGNSIVKTLNKVCTLLGRKGRFYYLNP
jgi:C1A family cysteine protease